MGVATAVDIADYFRNNIRHTREILGHLVRENVVLPITIDEWSDIAYILRDDLSLLKRAEHGEYKPTVTALLSPFDNLIWTRSRVRNLFGFEYRNRMYAPVASRSDTSGYYVMPILHRDHIIGQLDPRANRRTATLHVKSLSFEPNVRISGHLLKALAGTITDFMRFNHCEHIELERVTPTSARRQLIEILEKGHRTL